MLYRIPDSPGQLPGATHSYVQSKSSVCFLLTCPNFTSPPAWAATVSIWRNWRVILVSATSSLRIVWCFYINTWDKRDEVVPLVEILSRYDEFSWVPTTFQEILTKAGLIVPAPDIGTGPQLKSDKQWTSKTKIRLRLGNFCMSTDSRSSVFKMINPSDSKEGSLSVRNGVFSSKGAAFQEKVNSW